MKRLTSWLKAKLSRPKTPVAMDQPNAPSTVEPADAEHDDYAVEVAFNAELPGSNDRQEPGQTAVMPDIYAGEQDVTLPDLRILDQSGSAEEESEGFNPYDSAVLRRK